MAKKGRVEVSLDRLKELLESLRQTPHVEVGVFSGKSGRTDIGDMDNASLASIHEHGDARHGLPPRSMLVEPLKDHVAEIMASMREKAHELVEAGKAMQAWKLMGVAAEKVVLQAFATGGFGKWPQLKAGTIMGKLKGSLKRRKATMAKIASGDAKSGILIDSGQLRRAFSSRVRMAFR